MTVTSVESILAGRLPASEELPDRPRPSFERSEIVSKRHFILEEIPDLNTDAMGAACEKCGARFSWGQWLNASDRMKQMKCHCCANPICNEDFCLDPSERLLAELREPSYFDRTWYHATLRKNWLQSARETHGGEFLIHAGDRLTALARADGFYESNRYRAGRELEIFLYSFKFRGVRSFRPEFFDDMGDDWPEDLSHEIAMRVLANGDPSPAGDVSMDESFRGAGYYNRYEIPGGVSVIAPAKHIQLNTVEMVSLGF